MDALEVPVLTLPAELTIAQTQQCKDDILALIEEHDTIAIDDSKLVRIDTLGIQLLLAIVTQLASLNKQLQWHCQSPVIQACVKQLGVNEPILNQYVDI